MKKIFTIILIVGLTQNLFAQDTTSRKIDELLSAYAKLNKFNGSALVAWHGKVIFEKGYGFSDVSGKKLNEPYTIFQIASVTKQFTSAVVLKLVELKKIALTDKLSKYYPDFPQADKITIENLLTHTSGIYDYTHEDTVTKLDNEQKMISFLKKKKRDFEPGTNWSYSNSGYSILGFIIQKVSGITYERAVRKYIFDPLHMGHSGFDFERLQSKEKSTGYSVFNDSVKTVATLNDSSVVFAAGAIYSTVGDLYKWHEGLQSYQIVKKELMDKAYTPFKRNYGFGWVIDSIYGKRMIYHSGGISGFSSNFARITEDDACIALLNNKEGPGLETINREIMAILYKQPYNVPKKKQAINLPLDVLAKYVGTYDLQTPKMMLEMSVNNGKLLAHAINGPTFPLSAEKENFFYIQEGLVEIEFVISSDGKVDHIVVSQGGQKNQGKKIK